MGLDQLCEFFRQAPVTSHDAGRLSVGPAEGILLQLREAVAAAEAAVGLAIIIAIYRHKQTVNLDKVNLLSG